MKNARTTIWVMVMCFFLCSSHSFGGSTVYLDDGGTYDISWPFADDLWVDYEAPGMYTTVNWLDGAVMPYGYRLYAHEDSIVNICGGSIRSFLDAYDRSQVTVSAGTIWSSLFGSGSSQLTMTGGSIGYNLHGYGSSQLTMTGGLIGANLISYDSSQLTMTGGSIGGYLHGYESSQVDMSGGSIGNHLWASGSSQVSISGGSIGVDLYAANSSEVTVSGGSIGYRLLGEHDAVITIHGSDFAVDGVPFGYGELTSLFGGNWGAEPPRQLTGTLLSGEPIDNGFYIGQYAKIVLDPGVIPAPGALILGSIGVGLVGWLRTRRTL